MQNSENSIFESEQNSHESTSFEVIEGDVDKNEKITAGNIPNNESMIDATPTIIESKPMDQSKLNQITAELYKDGITNGQSKPSNTVLLWSWINENCYQPFYSSFKGQFVAEALQVSISIVPILFYQIIKAPYIPCQDLPETAFIEKKTKKQKPKTWKQKIFSLESLCVLCLATTVFMAGFLDNDDANNRNRNNEFRYSRNRPKYTKNAGNGFQQRKYGAYY